MDRTRLRHLSSLKYKEPSPFLVRLRALEPLVATSDLSANAKALRTNRLNEYRQLREAALFCHGMSKRLGLPVLLAKSESQDYDFVAMCNAGESAAFIPVQLKEVVPTALNPRSSLQAVLQSLGPKYVDSNDLTVAIHLNQRQRFDPTSLRIPSLPLGGLWVFGSTTPDQSRWALWGDFLNGTPYGTEFEYPAA